MKTAVADPPDKSPLYVLSLEEAIRDAIADLRELEMPPFATINMLESALDEAPRPIDRPST